jgi:hypothetical protein
MRAEAGFSRHFNFRLFQQYLRGAVATGGVTDVFVGEMYHWTGQGDDCAYVPHAIGEVNVRSV